MALTLDQAETIIAAARRCGHDNAMQPLAVVVLDAGGHVKAFAREDGASNLRFEIARGKANGGLAVGTGSRALMRRAESQAYFVQALNGLAGGNVMPVPGGVLVRDADGTLLGAVGISGDNSDNDEKAAMAGIEAAGLRAQPD